ncbi:uncharacterized protein LOC135837498 [Planococcus citri]|uniref:uncharacterized protein LOC135837498 n=1 Tax=Planococcus citri TaxID=170843 RepID=UPI0031F8D91E
MKWHLCSSKENIETEHVPVEAIRRQLITLLPVNMNAFMMGCAIGWLPVAIYFLGGGEEQVACSVCNLIASFNQFGKLVFAIPGGMVVDEYGRKKVTIGIAFLNFFSWLGITMWTTPSAHYIGQFALGIGQALTQEACLIIIGETASPAIRGQLSSVYQIFLSIGVILPAVLSVFCSSIDTINEIITFASFISLLTMVIATETSNFLISKSKLNQARLHLTRIRQGYSFGKINSEFESLKKYIENEKARKSQLDWWNFLQLKSVWQPLFICILIKFFTAGTGRNLFTTYVTSIFSSNGSIPKKFYPLIMQIIMLLINVITTFYIDVFPRRTLFIFGALFVAISNAFSALMSYFYIESNQDIFNWLFLLGNFSYLLFFNGTVQPINSIIRTELFPQAVKGLGGSLSIISQAISTIITFQIFNIIDEYFQLYHLYAVLTAYSVILCIIVYLYLPESRGSTLVDIQSKFQNGSLPYDAVITDVDGCRCDKYTSCVSKMLGTTYNSV